MAIELVDDAKAIDGAGFILGLGSQVKAHIERRYGLKWSPAARPVDARVRAERCARMWDCWQNGTPLDFRGDHYRLNLMVPLFDPGPIEHPKIPIHLAAVEHGDVPE